MTKLLLLRGIIITCAALAGVYMLRPDVQRIDDVHTKEKQANDLPCFLVMSDTHIDTSIIHSKYGSETGIDLWHSATQKMYSLIKTSHPTFIILLGDLPWHANRNNPAELKSALANTGFILRSLRVLADSVKIPLLYVPGNNDSQGGDYDAFTTNKYNPFNQDSIGEHRWPMITTAATVDDQLPSIADNAAAGLGCYSAYPLGRALHLRVIVLNSVIFVNNKGDYTGNAQSDATQAITWFKDQLQAVDSLHEYALIAMHVPPGKNPYGTKDLDFWDKTLVYHDTTTIQDAFLDLVNGHQHNIIGLLSSHTHMDGIKITTDRCKKFSNFFISIPSITADHNNNPAMKLVSYNPAQNFTLMNFTTYFNAFDQNGPTGWENAYSFDSLFHCPPQQSMRDYISAKFTDEKTMTDLKQYMQEIYAVKSSVAKKTDDMNKALLIPYQKEVCRDR